MRLSILAFVVAIGVAWLGAASSASAQGMMGPGMMNAQPLQANDPFGPGRIEYPTAQERYVEQLAKLRKKLLRATAEDGGQLSEAHRAAIQRELDSLNKAYAADLAPLGGATRR